MRKVLNFCASVGRDCQTNVIARRWALSVLAPVLLQQNL
jgi:hypothetical protein